MAPSHYVNISYSIISYTNTLYIHEHHTCILKRGFKKGFYTEGFYIETLNFYCFYLNLKIHVLFILIRKVMINVKQNNKTKTFSIFFVHAKLLTL